MCRQQATRDSIAQRMGLEVDLFVHPERISSQLICPICTQVLDHPVQTSTEHLFCEEELLEWMTRSSLCPVTKTELEPSSIRKPGRIIMNMLAELELRCPNTCHGCAWVGQNGQLEHHLKSCVCKSPEEMRRELEKKRATIESLTERVEALELQNEHLLSVNQELTFSLAECESKLRIYDAFLTKGTVDSSNCQSVYWADDSGSPSQSKPVTRHVGTDVDKLSRLRTLNTLSLSGEPKSSTGSGKIASGEVKAVHK